MNENNISISLPLPHLEVDRAKMDAVSNDLRSEKVNFELKGVTPYPVSESWVEIVLDIAKFMVAAGAGHYASKLYAMLDAATKSGITKFNAILKRGAKEVHCDIPRNDKDEAIRILTEALEKLKDESN